MSIRPIRIIVCFELRHLTVVVNCFVNTRELARWFESKIMHVTVESDRLVRIVVRVGCTA